MNGGLCYSISCLHVATNKVAVVGAIALSGDMELMQRTISRRASTPVDHYPPDEARQQTVKGPIGCGISEFRPGSPNTRTFHHIILNGRPILLGISPCPYLI